jgi:hypothetical protein
MALPGLTFTIRDGALGIVPPGSSNIHLKIGPAPFGLINTIQSAADLPALQAAIGAGGPLVEAAALALAVAGGKSGGVLVCPVNPSTYGTAGSVTHTAQPHAPVPSGRHAAAGGRGVLVRRLRGVPHRDPRRHAVVQGLTNASARY